MLIIYQANGIDLANISCMNGDTSQYFFYLLKSEGTVLAALELIHRYLGNIPVKLAVYSQTQGNLQGGKRGAINELNDRSYNVEITLPRDWFSKRRTIKHADCQAGFRCISKYMDDGQGWIC